jgi:sugar lactone lactonase YvrE
MRRWVVPIVVALSLSSTQPVLAAQPEQGVVRTLVDASGSTCNNPEGIEASASGLIYTAGLSGNVCVYTLTGERVRVVPIGSGRALLGLMFDRSGKTLYIADNAGNFSSGRVDALDVASGTFTVLAAGFANTNAITLDHHGTLFVSDSFAGSVTAVDPTTGTKTLWKQDVLLVPAGNPPFGANGVAFDRTESFLYVANTSTDRIMRIAVNADGSAGAISIFADGTVIDATTGTTHALDGADGIQFDVKGNLYVCANQANEIQVLSATGALIARYAGTGSNAMDFPASPIFHEQGLYIANLAFATPGGGKVSVLGVPFGGAPIAH